jgi:hypothetical protein
VQRPTGDALERTFEPTPVKLNVVSTVDIYDTVDLTTYDARVYEAPRLALEAPACPAGFALATGGDAALPDAPLEAPPPTSFRGGAGSQHQPNVIINLTQPDPPTDAAPGTSDGSYV